MTFSWACVEFLHVSLSGVRERDVSGRGYIVKRMCSLGERLQMSKSADDCQLCHKIYCFLKDIYKDHYHRPTTEEMPAIATYVVCTSDRLLNARNLVSSIHLLCDRETWWGDPGDFPRRELFFDVWADQGTPASMEFIDCQPIVRGDRKEAAGFASSLLNDCLSHHADCRLHEPTGEFNLPSRVLYIEDSEDCGNISVKLIESGGSSGRYCALSHCWGSKDKRPLRTTQLNITDHLSSIP